MRTPAVAVATANRNADLERRLAAMEQVVARLQVARPPPLIERAGSLIVPQTAHGFTVGTFVRYDATAAAYVGARADVYATAQPCACVVAVQSPDVFILASDGYVGGFTGLTAGTVYYLSASSAGGRTATPPAIPVPVLFATSTTGGFLLGGTAPLDAMWQPTRVLLTTSQTWTKPAGVKRLRVLVVGAGGGGAGSSDNITLGYVAATSGGSPTYVIQGRRCGGGGGGGSAVFADMDVTQDATLAVTIGAAGTAGAIGASGGAGGLSSVIPATGGGVVAYGGGGGTVNNGGLAGHGGYYPAIGVRHVACASGADGHQPMWTLYSAAAAGGYGGYGPNWAPAGGPAGALDNGATGYGCGGSGGQPVNPGQAGMAGAVWLYY